MRNVLLFLFLVIFLLTNCFCQSVKDTDIQVLEDRLDFFKNTSDPTEFNKTLAVLNNTIKNTKNLPLKSVLFVMFGTAVTYIPEFDDAAKFSGKALKLAKEFSEEEKLCACELFDTLSTKFRIIEHTNYTSASLTKIEKKVSKKQMESMFQFLCNLGEYYYLINDFDNFHCITYNYVVVADMYYEKNELVRSTYQKFQEWYLEFFGNPLIIEGE